MSDSSNEINVINVISFISDFDLNGDYDLQARIFYNKILEIDAEYRGIYGVPIDRIVLSDRLAYALSKATSIFAPNDADPRKTNFAGTLNGRFACYKANVGTHLVLLGSAKNSKKNDLDAQITLTAKTFFGNSSNIVLVKNLEDM